MRLDAAVAHALRACAGLSSAHEAFGLSPHLVRCMTRAVAPAPLHWGAAIRALDELRPEAHPADNVAALTRAARAMDGAYRGYCEARLHWLAGAGSGGRPELAEERHSLQVRREEEAAASPHGPPRVASLLTILPLSSSSFSRRAMPPPSAPTTSYQSSAT